MSFVKYTRMYSLRCGDGGHPRAPLLAASDGRLHGTSWQNGPNDGGGLVDLDGDGIAETFKSASSNYFFIAQDLKDQLEEAETMLAAPEVIAALETGLNARLDVNRKQCPGTVWSVAKNGTGFRIEHAFSQLDDAWRNGDGYQPIAPLVEHDGWIYGTANQGGLANLATAPSSTIRGAGSAYRYRPGQPGTLELVHSFGSQARFNDGGIPSGALIPDGAGGFYSTCQKGSDNGAGVIARIAPDGTTTQVYRFDRHTRGVPGGPALPLGAPVLGPDGKLYGWTTYGGANTCTLGGDLQTAGCIWSLDPSTGALEVLHSFDAFSSPWNADNSPLQSVLLASDGNLYGTHQHAGANGSGIVWRLELPSHVFTVLHTFGPRNATAVPRFKNDDGALPLGTLVEDRYGFLYGTCSMGGDFGHGTIFQLSRDGAQFVTLHSFGYGADGHHPHAGVVIPTNSSQAFGTTFAGGDSVDVNGQGGFGVVYAMTLPNTVHAKTGVEPGVMVESDPIRVGCVTAPTIKTTAPAEYSVNGGMWMSAVGSIAPGDELRIRRVSSTVSGQRVLAGYSIGFQSGSFGVTTR